MVTTPGLNQASTLPSKWNLRDNKPAWQPAVRDQGQFYTCWAFATAEAAEGSLVRNGVYASTSAASQVSPNHTVQSVYMTGTFLSDNVAPQEGSKSPYKLGGNDYMATTAWTHFYGAQKEQTYPYPPSSDLSLIPTPISAANLQSQAYHLQNWWLLPDPYTSKLKYSATNVNTIKKAIYKYGALSTSLTVDASFINTIGTSNYFYAPGFYYANHEVILIGWNNSISRNNFNSNGKKPAGNGAFLVQNQWGSSYTYLWVSYYDKSLQEIGIFNMRSATPTSTNYQSKYDWTAQQSYDSLGWLGNYVYYTPKKKSTGYANKFTNSAATSITLRAVQFITPAPNVSYSVSVYVGPTSGASPTTGGKAAVIKGTSTKSITGKAVYAGWQTVALPVPVIIASGQQYSIVVKAKVKSGFAKVPVESYVKTGASAGISRPTINSGESYMMTPTGKWKDMYSLEVQMGASGILGNTNIIALTSPVPTFTLAYDSNGGTATSPASIPLKFKAAYGTLPDTTRAGYTFKGWYTAKTKGTKVSSATLMGAANRTLYAQWTANKYKVTFDANGGSTPKVKTKKVLSITATTAKAYGTLPTTARKGYTFAGWYTDPTVGTKVTSKTKFSNAAPQTLYAHWTAKTYTVKFDPRSGTVTPKSIKVKYDSTYGASGAMPMPTRGTYVFGGWFTKASGGTLIDDSTIVKITATQTLYAHWS